MPKYHFQFSTKTGHASLVKPYSQTAYYLADHAAMEAAERLARKLYLTGKGNGYFAVTHWQGSDLGLRVVGSGNVSHRKNPAPSAHARSRKLKSLRARLARKVDEAQMKYGPNSWEYKKAWANFLRGRKLYAGSSAGKKKGRDAEKLRDAFQKAASVFEEGVLKKFKPRGASNARMVMERYSLQPSNSQERKFPHIETQLGPQLFAKYKKAYKAAKLMFHAFDREKYA